MNNKGQITIFIIAGILILLLASLVFYIRWRYTQTTAEIGLEQENIPDWSEPVKIYVEDCIEETSIKAFKMLGQHGGYIDFYDYDSVRRLFRINPEEPTESDAVALSPGSEAQIAYWFYMHSPNSCQKCTMTSLMPSLAYIEQQLNRYMERELLECLDGFRGLKEQNLDISEGEIDVSAHINSEDVSFLVDYPLKVRLGEATSSIDKFFYELDFNFYEIYLLAYLTTFYQRNQLYLEDILLHIIASYSSPPSPERLPPIAWFDDRASITSWKMEDTEDKLRTELLPGLIPLMQLKDTKGASRIKTDKGSLEGLYDVLFLDFLNLSFPQLDVSFVYNPSWPIHLDITPRTGSILKPMTSRSHDTIGFFPQVTNNYYGFFYDLSVPFIVLVRDEDALSDYGEDGYTFMFALEANLRDNKDMYMWNQGQGTVGVTDYSQVEASVAITDSEFTECINLTGDINTRWRCPKTNQVYSSAMECSDNCKTETTTTADSSESSLFCEADQRISGNNTIDVKDALTMQPVDDVIISYGCGNYRKCPIAVEGDNGVYVTRLPVCIGHGYLLLEKDGYISRYVPDVSSRINVSAQHDVYMEPVREKEVEAYYINISNMFRVKRWLAPETGSGVLDKLYHRVLIDRQLGLYNHYGLFAEIMDSIEAAAGQGKITESQADALLDVISSAGQDVLNAYALVADYKHWHEVRKDKLKQSLELATGAAETAWTVVKNPSTYAGSGGAIDIDAISEYVLKDIIFSLNKELNNLRFKGATRSDALPLSEGQHLTISYAKMQEDIYETDVLANMIDVDSNGSTIRLVPGRYFVNMLARDEKGAVIAASGYFPEINYTPLVIGGGELSNQTGLWNVGQNKLDASSKIRFYFFKLDTPMHPEDMSETGELANYSKHYRAYIEPEFIG